MEESKPDSGICEGLTLEKENPWEKGNEHTELKKKIELQTQSLQKRAEGIKEIRRKLVRYQPGQWLVEMGGMRRSDFAIPEVTTLLLVGAMGAGKSTLVNNLIRVLNNKTRDFDRAQVCGDASENGTYFLDEYMVCEGKSNICVFDSRGLSEVNTVDGLAVLENWMIHGVRHGQMVIRESDSSRVKEAVQRKGRHGHHKQSKKRAVNFVIFVVNAMSVHKMQQSGDLLTRVNLLRLYKCPFLTFKDDRPVVVMTHGDELDDDDRLSTRIFLGDLLGVSPVDHIFDIAGFTGRVKDEEDSCSTSDTCLLEMLEFALQRADRNLPYKLTVPAIFTQLWDSALSGYGDLDAHRKVALGGLAVCWVILFGLLMMAYSSISHFILLSRV